MTRANVHIHGVTPGIDRVAGCMACDSDPIEGSYAAVEPIYERLALAQAITAFADKYGWFETKAIIETELEGKIEKCVNCGVLTDQWNEDLRRQIHDECLGEWLFTRVA